MVGSGGDPWRERSNDAPVAGTVNNAQWVEEESARTVMAGLWEVIQNKGLFCALYSGRGSHFFVTPEAGEKVDKHRLTQVGRAMRELGVQMIPAYSPQARGRGERSFGTWQGRLPQELRLAGIRSLEEASQFLRDRYFAEFNAKFPVAAAEKGSAFRRTARTDLEWVFTVQTERVVGKDNTVAIGERFWRLDKTRFRATLAGCTAPVHEHLDHSISIRYGPHVVGRYGADGKALRRPFSKPNRKQANPLRPAEGERWERSSETGQITCE